MRDGSGIRSVVFLKGCPLRCKWCHNPEGLAQGLGIQWQERDCVRCGACGDAWRDMAATGKLPKDCKRELAGRCPTGALKLVGKVMEASDVVADVIKDRRYFRRSSGGMTISGGEPMNQFSFALDLARKVSEQGLSADMETSGMAPTEHYETIAPYVDEFLWDYKATGAEQYKRLTGVSDELILRNLEMLYARGSRIVLRCPLIPDVNDDDAHLRGIADLARSHPKFERIEVMPYHKMGVSKAKRIGYDQREYEVPTKELKAYWKAYLEALSGREIRMN